MSHDLYASWATQEITRLLKRSPNRLFAAGVHGNLEVFANRESGRIWPIPDGRITAEEPNNNTFEVAVEMKRINEGVHGILTAIGQSQAYIYKGYSGSAIVVPNNYDSLSNPANYIIRVIDHTRPTLPIGVFSYDDPDMSIATPFLNKITIHRNVNITGQGITGTNFLARERSKTQWAHLREGSSDAHAFFKYLQTSKQLDSTNPQNPVLHLPADLIAAVQRISNTPPINFLSSAPGTNFHDFVWRNFWFKYILTPVVANPWTNNNGQYSANDADSLILLDANTYKKFFGGKANSIKNKLVKALNNGTITEIVAWEEFAKNINGRAHSYREDVDSGLEHLSMIASDGKPSDVGYTFVDSCERTNDCYSGKPWLILGAAILKNGNLISLLHYIYKVSEERFRADPFAFTTQTDRTTFDQANYLLFLRKKLANDLHVMNTAMARGGQARQAFQGEFAILRKFDFITRFRIGVGLVINWPAIQQYLDYEL